MGSLLKPWVVRYLDADGRQVRKGTPGARQVRERTSKWYGQFVDPDGRRRRVPLCTDKTAARQMLAAMERDAQLGRVGLVSPYAAHRRAPIAGHVADYKAHMKNQGVSPKGQAEETRKLEAVIAGCNFRTLGDINPDVVSRFLADMAEDRKVSARTSNTYLGSIRSFVRWCVKRNRLGENVLECLQKAKGEARRRRRALTEDELVRLLRAARERPLMDALTIRSGKRAGERVADTRRPETRAKYERRGREHALIWKTLVYTGLRRGELEVLEARNLVLDGPRPCVVLPEAATKNRKGANLPLRADLVQDLRAWLETTGRAGTDRVFEIGRNLYKILRNDLAAAGIPYKDKQGRTIDVHALRHTTCSHLAKAKVSPRVAQEFMRHADIRLTMQVYADPSILDEAEALAALPELPLPED